MSIHLSNSVFRSIVSSFRYLLHIIGISKLYYVQDLQLVVQSYADIYFNTSCADLGS